MTVEYVVLLERVELTTSSVLRVTEDSTASDLTVIDPATGSALAETKGFYLRGDGSDDDLLQVLVETIQSHTGTNTYTGALTFSTDPASPSATVTIALASGSDDFQINWGHANTTVDPALFGFADADTANNTGDKSGTLSPSCVWVSPEVPEIIEEHPEYDASVVRARSGRVRALRRGGPYHVIDLGFRFLDSRRVLRTANTSDTAATFASFLEQVGDGTSFELHTQSIATGTTLDALTIYTRRREYWRFDEDTSAAFRPERQEPGLSLYAFALRAEGFGETQVDPGIPDLITDDLALNLDASDSSTFTEGGGTVQQWRDLSGNDYHVDADFTSDPVRDLAVQNGLDAVRFGNGSADRLDSTASLGTILALDGSGSGTWTSYAVVRPSNILSTNTNPNNNDYIWGHANGRVYIALRGDGAGNYYAVHGHRDSLNVFNAVQAELVSETDTAIIMARRTGNTIGVSVNGGTEAPMTSVSGTGMTFVLTIGRNNQTGVFFDGWLCQLLAYRAEHTPEQVAQNVAALSAKWGV